MADEKTINEEFVIEATNSVGEDERTPYQFAGLLSQVLGRKVQPQMLYTYTKKGYLKSHINSVGHQVVPCEEQVRFLSSRLQAEANKAEKIEQQLAGKES